MVAYVNGLSLQPASALQTIFPSDLKSLIMAAVVFSLNSVNSHKYIEF